MPQLLPGTIEDVVDQLVPQLQERGLYRTAYEGTTLREHLGLPRPAPIGVTRGPRSAAAVASGRGISRKRFRNGLLT